MNTQKIETESSSDIKTSQEVTPSISLLGESKQQDVQDVVGFVSEGKTISREFDSPDVPLNILRPIEEVEHTIQKFLSRPTRIGTYEWNVDKVSGLFDQTFDVMETIKNASNFRIFKEKLKGFYGFNATANLKIVVNAQPFHSGILILYYIPQERSNPIKYSGTEFVNIPGKLKEPFMTGCPCVYLNVTTQSEVTLSVPYVGPSPFLNLTSSEVDFGTFHIHSIVELRDSTNNPIVDYSVYLYFTEVKLFGSSPLFLSSYAAVRTEPQMEVQLQEQKRNKQRDPPAQQVGFLSTLARNTIGSIPVVGSYLQNLATIAGLTKPHVQQSPSFLTMAPYGNSVTMDASIPAFKLSAMSGQGCMVDQLGVDKFDECDLNFIVRKPTLLEKFTWTTSDTAGHMLKSYPVEPQAVDYAENFSLQSIAPTRLRYVASCFRLWRGMIRYTFHVAATKFHTGRLRFVYSLGGDPGNLNGNYSYSFNRVIDIRDGMVFTIDCPYFAGTPWRHVPHHFDAATNRFVHHGSKSAMFNDEPCFLQIYIENRLRATSTVSSTVEVLVMQSGGSDFEFAAPIAPHVVSRNLEFIQITTPQVDVEMDNDIEPISMVNSNDVEPVVEALSTCLTIGEKVTNVRELIKRFYPLFKGSLKQGVYLVFPFEITSGYITQKKVGNEEPVLIANTHGEYLKHFVELYRYYRGGMRYQLSDFVDGTNSVRFDPHYPSEVIKYYGNLDNTFVAMVKLYNEADSTKVFEPSRFLEVPCAVNLNYSRHSDGVTIEVPYYSRLVRSFAKVHWTPSPNAHVFNIQNAFTPSGTVFISVNEVSTRDTIISRAAADDFNFGFLLGAPVCFVNIGRYTCTRKNVIQP